MFHRLLFWGMTEYMILLPFVYQARIDSSHTDKPASGYLESRHGQEICVFFSRFIMHRLCQSLFLDGDYLKQVGVSIAVAPACYKQCSIQLGNSMEGNRLREHIHLLPLITFRKIE